MSQDIDAIIRLQAKEHPIVNTERFESLEEFCLFLIHSKAYEEAAALSKGRTVLDLGCNNGYGTGIIAKQCKTVIGVDVSANAINQAKNIVKGNNISFEVVDGKDLPFDASMFDLIISFQVIEHIANLDEFMSEILRVLSKDGFVIFTTPNAAIRIDPGMKPWNKFHVQEFMALELEKILKKWFDNVQG
jgi:2-polyprenyl-3-methyl-5-hydroxy-6-metoxy-1,4-benzoquinol methylase